MPNGDSLSYPSEYYDQVEPAGMPSQEGVIILPMPDDTDLYYVFHYTPTDTLCSLGGYDALNLYYSVVDMRADGGMGAVTSKNIPIIQNELLSFCRLAACRHANGRDWWIVKNVWHENIYYEFLLTPDGLHGPYIQQIGPLYSTMSEENSYSTFSPDGRKYASITASGPIVVMDFDRCTGLFSNPDSIYNSNSYDPVNNPNSGGCGLSFSPSGRFLYVTNTLELNQYDLLSSHINDSIRIETLNDTIDMYLMDVLQPAPNGKIYVSCYQGGSHRMHVINHPDSLGLACDFHMYDQPTATLNTLNLPYFPNFRLGAAAGSCDTIHASITDITNAHPAFASVSPNPASSRADIFYSTNSNSQNLAQMYDISGLLIWEENSSGSSGSLAIDLSSVPSGMYLVKFIAGDNVLLNAKLVVDK